MKKIIKALCFLIALGLLSFYLIWKIRSVDIFSSSKKTLKIMTYSSFAGVFSPGEKIKTLFEKKYNCQIQWIKIPDSTLFAQRLSLKKDGFKTDVVLGFDQLSFLLLKNFSWEKISVDKNIFIPLGQEVLSSFFVPYNWSPMSFLSRKPLSLSSLEDLLNPDFEYKISLPTPQTSTVGLQFYYWVWSNFKKETAAYLRKLKKQLWLSPSWSTSYSLFQRGHVALSFSFLSSLLYHQKQNQKNFYFVSFEIPLPFQAELVGVPEFCTECDLAKIFVSFLLTPEIQKLLYEENYMLPIRASLSVKLFSESIPKLKFLSYKTAEDFLNHKSKWLKLWDKSVK